jgi:GGDEF domain-containing protein
MTTLKELEYLAYHDILTKLHNRTWLYHKLVKLDHRAHDYVYFIDINDLHIINNRDGHTAGDIHIMHCVIEIQTKIQEMDMFIRYAGDEFILLSNTKDIIKTNDWYTVGQAKIYDGKLMLAIRRADIDMIANKKLRKSER